MAGVPERKVYLVDDDDSMRKALHRLLRLNGYAIESFSSARSFLDSVPSHEAEGFLLLDLRMPEMDGFELQEKLKELHCPLKIIMITADARTGDREQAPRNGALGFVQKPFDNRTLLELIEAEIVRK